MYVGVEAENSRLILLFSLLLVVLEMFCNKRFKKTQDDVIERGAEFVTGREIREVSLRK